MHRPSAGLALLSALLPLVLLAACTEATLPEGAQQPVSSAQVPPQTVQPAVLRTKILGEWRAAPPPSEARLLQLAELALADPLDPAALEKIQPTEAERQHYRNIQRLRKEEPGSPLLAELRRKVAEMDSIRLTFTAEKLVSTSPSGTNVERYKVEEEIGDQLIVITEGEGPPEKRRAIFRFIDDDHIVLVKGYRQVPFNRRGSSSALPSSPAPSGISGSSDPMGSAAPGGATAAQGMPAKTGDAAFDTCVTDYFACVAQMPPESQDAMKESLDLVRLRMQTAAKDPADRQSFAATCYRTVQMIKSTGLCR